MWKRLDSHYITMIGFHWQTWLSWRWTKYVAVTHASTTYGKAGGSEPWGPHTLWKQTSGLILCEDCLNTICGPRAFEVPHWHFEATTLSHKQTNEQIIACMDSINNIVYTISNACVALKTWRHNIDFICTYWESQSRNLRNSLERTFCFLYKFIGSSKIHPCMYLP